MDTGSSIDNTLHGSSTAVDKSIIIQIEKAPEFSSIDLTCHVFSFGDAVAHLSVVDTKNILTIET